MERKNDSVFPFFKLERELRNQIYYNLVVNYRQIEDWSSRVAIKYSPGPRLRMINRQFKDEYEKEVLRGRPIEFIVKNNGWAGINPDTSAIWDRVLDIVDSMGIPSKIERVTLRQDDPGECGTKHGFLLARGDYFLLLARLPDLHHLRVELTVSIEGYQRSINWYTSDPYKFFDWCIDPSTYDVDDPWRYIKHESRLANVTVQPVLLLHARLYSVLRPTTTDTAL